MQIVGGEPGVGKAVIGELHQAGGGAADAIEARLLAGRGRREAKILQRRLDHRQRGAKFVRHHAHKLPLVEAGFTLNLQFARQALLLLQLAVFSTHPQDGNDQHRNDVDDQRVLPEGIDRHMERDNLMDRQLHQHRGDDIERRQQTQQQGGTVDSFFAPQPPGGEQQHRGDNDEYYPFNLHREAVKPERNTDLQHQVEYHGGDQQLMKSRHILLQIKNLAVQPEGGGIAEQREATDHKILEGQRGVAEEPLREAVQSGHQRIIEREKTDPP